MIPGTRANGTVARHLATELVTGFRQIMRRHRDSGMAGEISPKVQQLLARALRSLR
jgi:hypothetical protein